ncbi:hypothetical protein KL86DYS1_31060 [uncultured Dysgonomonas sp.]|uniref:Uncharacterized protein n=1 Tax=uncultured Dysgonomonas sp. TaxID=206096 RepID=A0A212K0K6_9BACT|nr:hypothetical protein KL86DYS1_31060 [uncultured Dysgonomonas sp.]
MRKPSFFFTFLPSNVIVAVSLLSPDKDSKFYTLAIDNIYFFEKIIFSHKLT